MSYAVNGFIQTNWKVLPRRVPEGRSTYYRHWVDADSDYFISISAEQREAPDQYIGNRPPVAMLGLLEAKALRHLLDGFIARAETRRASKPVDEFSEVYNLPPDTTMDELIEHATGQWLGRIVRDHPHRHIAMQAAGDEMRRRRERQQTPSPPNPRPSP